LSHPRARAAAEAAAAGWAVLIKEAVANGRLTPEGAVTRAQLDDNLAALAVGQLPALSLAEPPDVYWAERAARPWR